MGAVSLARPTASSRPEDRLLELIDEQVPPDRAQAVRAFARAYLRRLGGGDSSEGIAPEALLGEVLVAVRVRLRARRRRDGRARLQPDARASTATSRSARCWRPTPTTCRSWSTPSRASSTRAGAGRRGCCTRSWPPSARATGASAPCATRAARRTASRSCTSTSTGGSTDGELAELEDARPGVARRRPRGRARLPGDARARRGDDRSSPARAPSRYEADEVEEVVDFLAWLQRGEFVFLGAREYDFSQDGITLVPGSGPGHPRRRGASPRSRSRAASASTSCRDYVRRSALDGDLLLVDKANAPAPVHRRERMDYIGVRRVDAGRRDHRRCRA